jgi:predicted phage baseplate assembly protein
MPSEWNRPGLRAIQYRIGTFSSFFNAMKARLSSSEYPGLAGLRTRDPSDWTIALLDGWASIGDVLTFYQERIANEGYVRTSTQRSSVLELGRTVGYALRPGVAASAYLAYTMDPAADATVPAGTLAQSTPMQGGQPQAFETSDDLHAKGGWNVLGVRTQQPQPIDISQGPPRELFLAGTNLNLNPDDVLLLVEASSAPGGQATTVAARIRKVDVQTKRSRTLVRLAQLTVDTRETRDALAGAPAAIATTTPVPGASQNGKTSLLAGYEDAVKKGLLTAPAAHPPNPLHLKQSVQQTFGTDHEAIAKTLTVLQPQISSTLFPALTKATAAPKSPVEVYRFRVRALPFGANAPKRLEGFREHVTATVDETGKPHEESLSKEPEYGEWRLAGDEGPNRIWLDRFYPALTLGTWVVVNGPGEDTPVIATIERVEQLGRAQYGISGSPSHLRISQPWFPPPQKRPDLPPPIGFLRETNVFAQSEALTLAETALADPVENDTIDLDGLYDGLNPGRWLIVAGTRSDVPGAPAAELVMLSTSKHTVDPSLPGDTLHTRLTLSNPLAYKYERTSVQIFGNVVRSTNGQTWKETLGSGNGSLAFQQFVLKQKPLTFVSAPSSAGVQSTLQVSVNGIPWTEASSLDAMRSNDRSYVTRTDNAMNTSVIFGDGIHGARLPTGVENVTAVYRAGIGQSGDVPVNQITLLASRPLGVKAVTNPQSASGGADPESADQGRMNAPLAAAALDRIVSLSDYEAFARTFAGIAKALTKEFSGSPPTVHVTIAGAGDAPIVVPSDLVTNLIAALSAAGGARVKIDVQPRGLIVLVLSANVALQPGVQWENVEPAIRAVLLSQFGFDQRSLAQDVFLSEVIAAIQNVAGVAHVKALTFDGVADSNVVADLERLARKSDGGPNPKVIARPPRLGADGKIRPAQLAFFEPTLPESIVLQEVAP